MKPSEMNTGHSEHEDQAAGLRQQSSRSFLSSFSGSNRCIAVGSGKGGVGKTVVSVGLSLALSEAGHKVLLFDGDMGLANVDLQMGLIPEFTVQDVIFGHATMSQACLHVEGGPDVLVSASGAPELVDLSPARRRLFIEDLFRFAASYEYFLIDTGAGIGGGSTDFLAACPEVLVVLTNEPTSLMDAYAVIKTLHVKGASKGLGVVVNMVDSLDEGEMVFDRLNGIAQQFLGLTLTLEGVLVYDRRVSEAIRHQESIVRYASGGAAAQCLRALSRKIVMRPRVMKPSPDLERWVMQWERTALLGAGKDQAT